MPDFFLEWCLYSLVHPKSLSLKEIHSMSHIPDELIDEIDHIKRRMNSNSVSVIHRDNTQTGNYRFSWMPYISYVLWNTTLLEGDLLWIVWPRRHSLYAKDIVTDLLSQSREYALATVSWGAEGIDMLVHVLSCTYAIPTVVVIGAWLKRYMQSAGRKKFADDIVSAGGLIYSAFRLNQPPTTYTFPQRNRYIAGMSKALFVPEAWEKSGSLITVDFAATMRTPCYSVRQDIYSSNGVGIQAARRAGKIHISPDIWDVLVHFNQHKNPKEILPGNEELREASEHENTLIQHIKDLFDGHEKLSLEYLCANCTSDIAEILSILIQWELTGVREETESGIYRLK